MYLYYRDKNAILHAHLQQDLLQLRKRFSPLQHVADRMERLKAMGSLISQVAQDNPEMYDLMFVTKAPMSFLDHIHAQEWHEGKATFDLLKQTVTQCIQSRAFLAAWDRAA